ncbi:MAG: outer membrane protein assembly factor BamD [Verrucomicrobia bacterium]|nr:outer membrane protein assembly factor BamD [Verrucomicrobiota bacterium]
MNRWLFLAFFAVLLAFPMTCPAPLTYRPGEGWVYESVGGGGKWVRTRAKDQLEVAQAAYDKGDYGTSLKAARRTVKVWPLSDYAPKAQFLLGQTYEKKHQDELAFKAYQTLLEKYPKLDNFEEVVARQYEIANRFLGGQWFKLWGYVPFFPNMDKTADMYEKVIRNGPFTETAPQAQMKIGSAREKQADFPLAVKAYERAADRYHDQQTVASDALYKSGLAYHKQTLKAEYDQGTAEKAMSAFGDFTALYPEDPRVPDARKKISNLKSEQARGSYEIARFYEKKKRWDGALVYYSDVVEIDPDSKFAEEARKKIEQLRLKVQNRPVPDPVQPDPAAAVQPAPKANP